VMCFMIRFSRRSWVKENHRVDYLMVRFSRMSGDKENHRVDKLLSMVRFSMSS
jgi:hypothetical protein